MISKEHLAFEELLAFSAIEDLSEESMELSSRVYAHLRVCADCRRVLDGVSDFTYSIGKEAELTGFERSFASGEEDEDEDDFDFDDSDDDFDSFTDRR